MVVHEMSLGGRSPFASLCWELDFSERFFNLAIELRFFALSRTFNALFGTRLHRADYDIDPAEISLNAIASLVRRWAAEDFAKRTLAVGTLSTAQNGIQGGLLPLSPRMFQLSTFLRRTCGALYRVVSCL